MVVVVLQIAQLHVKAGVTVFVKELVIPRVLVHVVIIQADRAAVAAVVLVLAGHGINKGVDYGNIVKSGK